jgi:CTP:molybdopterin cytidylyltransferase MocA
VIIRRDNLESALGEIEGERLAGATTVVVNLQWWSGLSAALQEAYRVRADRAGIALVADDSLSRHYVEVRGKDEGPPMSTERPV